MSEEKKLVSLKIVEINLDGGTQPRIKTDPKTVEKYAKLWKQDCEFPAPVIFKDDEGNLYPGDGHHRILAAKLAGHEEVECELRDGSLRDAMFFAIQTNSQDALKMSTADKRRSVDFLLSDAEWRELPDREIARSCCVSHPFVGKRRRIVNGEDQGRKARNPQAKKMAAKSEGKSTKNDGLQVDGNNNETPPEGSDLNVLNDGRLTGMDVSAVDSSNEAPAPTPPKKPEGEVASEESKSTSIQTIEQSKPPCESGEEAEGIVDEAEPGQPAEAGSRLHFQDSSVTEQQPEEQSSPLESPEESSEGLLIYVWSFHIDRLEVVADSEEEARKKILSKLLEMLQCSQATESIITVSPKSSTPLQEDQISEPGENESQIPRPPTLPETPIGELMDPGSMH